MSDSLRTHGLWSARLLCSWDYPGKSTGVDCHSFLQRIFPTQGSTWVSFIAGRLFTIWATGKISKTKYTQLQRKVIIMKYTVKTYFKIVIQYQSRASLVAQWQRNHLPKQEMWVQSLGWEDPWVGFSPWVGKIPGLEKETATPSSILAWRTVWTEESGSLSSMQSQKSWAWLIDNNNNNQSINRNTDGEKKEIIPFMLIGVI